jgi:catechol 2,3-dioxygenase-like lactoylglutathione lyase family enzyme
VPASLDVIGLVVEDMARSLAFYRVLGLAVPADADDAPHVEIPLTDDPAGQRLALDTEATIRSFDPGWTPATGGSRMSLAFRQHSVAEVDAAYGRITAAGYPGHLPPWDAFWGQRYAVVHDPDGNGIDLYCPAS